MKRPKWYAKVLYIAFALALAVGLMPVVAAGGHASCDITVEDPPYKVGDDITFSVTFTPPGPDDWDWTAGPQATVPTQNKGATLTTQFTSIGPKTVTVTASWGSLNQTCQSSIVVGEGLIPQVEYNVISAEATFRVPTAYEGNVTCWAYYDNWCPGGGSYQILSGGAPGCAGSPSPCGGSDSVTIKSNSWGRVTIEAHACINISEPAGNDTLSAIKKWGKIHSTALDPEEGEVQIVWNENYKKWEGNITITETVTGMFKYDGCENATHVAQGADVEWWILDSRAPVHTLPSDVPASELVPLIEAMQADYPAPHVGFGDCDTKTATTISDTDGESSVTLEACGEEAVKIVVVAKYPDPTEYDQMPVFPEIASVNFWTQEVEKVPQVRWAGEKIVLEKQFGTNYAGNDVSFKLENQSPGCLEGLYAGDRDEDLCQTVWTTVQPDGVARCQLVCEDEGEIDVDAALWNANSTKLINQHGFVVFYLKFEDIVLGNVVGNRTGHDSGLFVPENAWNTTTDVTAEDRNVSADALLRVRVRGWFVGDNLSWRESRVVDLDGNGDPDLRLPEGRWILPDDWPTLAGADWAELRPHWDIMDNPWDDVRSVIDANLDKAEEQGPYHNWTHAGGIDTIGNLVAASPVIGPYSSLDDYTPNLHTPKLDRKTIVRNAKLDWCDAPMPPAKIVFKMTEGPGYFKDLNKGHVYYETITQDLSPLVQNITYTNPFYYINIPASNFTPAFVNNGGYDWDSDMTAYGPYPFWDIINQLPGATHSDPQHPTKVEVYSDNHGEAMVWLNGDWNLDWAALEAYWPGYGIDIPPGTIVGTGKAKAMADYPYFRKHLNAGTNYTVSKNWTWGKDVRGADIHTFAEGTGHAVNDTFDTRMVYDVLGALNTTKVAFIWVCDRDGMAATGERLDWNLDNFNTKIADYTGNHTVVNSTGASVGTFSFTHGLLTGTSGVRTDDHNGYSFTMSPSAAALACWNDTWPGDSCHHAVGAILVYASNVQVLDLSVLIDEGTQIGTLLRDWTIDFGSLEGTTATLGDSNGDGDVNMGDVTMTERIILDLNDPTPGADANQDGAINMGDVTKTERIILRA
jgi:hypothetical protein